MRQVRVAPLGPAPAIEIHFPTSSLVNPAVADVNTLLPELTAPSERYFAQSLRTWEFWIVRRRPPSPAIQNATSCTPIARQFVKRKSPPATLPVIPTANPFAARP